MRSTLASLVVLAALAVPAAPALARATDGTIVSVAGTTAGFAGDGGPATQAQLDTPRDVAFLSPTNIVIADFNNDRIRQVRPDGIIVTAAGGAGRGLAGDGGPATSAQLDRPRGVTGLPGGGYLIADTFNHRIRRVAPDGTITTVAGTTPGLSGDGSGAAKAQLSFPSDTAVLPGGGYHTAHTRNDRIRRVGPEGTITTVAGTSRGFGGDGGPATAAQLNQPRDVAIASDGAILIADTGNDRIRRVDPNGTITTVAGVGAGFAGDGDPARTARLQAPFSVAALPHRGFLFTDTANNRVRRVTPLGAIFSVAGGAGGNAGNGGLAKTALLNQPGAVAVAPGGGFLVADTGNATVRRVSDVGAVPAAVFGRSVGVAPAVGGVTVRPTGTPAFLALQEEDLVPTRSDVDSTGGQIAITTARDATGVQQTAQLYRGPFSVAYRATGSTAFRLVPLTGCGTGARAAVARIAAVPDKRKRKPGRKRSKRKTASHSLWVSETGGNWQTATGAVSAAAIGTRWHTTLSCEGTRVSVRQGVVRVRDKLHKRTVVLRAGQTYLAQTRRSHRGQ
jgi:NHL repeat